jgi:pimeloyl-ACP methyl ester carboxylesterase
MNNKSKPNKKRRWIIYIFSAVVLWAGLVIVSEFFPGEERKLRQGLRDAVENTFPRQAAELAKSFGLTFYGEQSAALLQANPAAPSVVLIHGLDDPRKVWMNLAPALTGENINVWQMHYPNDQPIVDSAQFFSAELERLKQLGIGQITLIAHSMGGLVSREMLTNPQIAYIEKSLAGTVPKVIGLIMVGTPNHGSELARFRVLGEIREQLVNLVEGRGHILGGILDGAGGAKIDLLPDSQFLRTLNERPHPEDVKMLCIAGKVSPWAEKDIDHFLNSIRENVPAAGQATLTDLEVLLISMSDGLGDGLVTVESTRLDGVDHRTVHGNHLSMIRNISIESSRVPPAIPVIIEYLGQMYSR